MIKPISIPKELLESLLYDEVNGVLIWKSRPRSHFQKNESHTRFNRVLAGKPAGCQDSGKYLRLMFNGKRYLNHRLIFALVHGYEVDEIDHIDGNKQNNFISNLRPATRSQNRMNIANYANNKSGGKNISFHKDTGKYQVSMTVEGVRYYGGLFSSIEDAKDAVIAMSNKLQGEFSTQLHTRSTT